MILATGGAALVVAGFGWVVVRRPRLEVQRRIEPGRPQAGGAAQVNLRIRGTRRPAATTIGLADQVDSVALAERAVACPGRGAVVAPSYRLPGLTRGLRRVGPLAVRVVDPFGLAVRLDHSGPVTEVLVRPRIDPVASCPSFGRDDLRSSAYRPAARSFAGEDFAGLRPFQVGDDIRRVHWPSSARRDDLMVRQLETPGHKRVTVVLDTSGQAGERFEAAVSAAASILHACTRGRLLVRLVTTGTDSGFGQGDIHFEELLTRLALARPAETADGREGPLRGAGQHGAVVLLATGAVPGATPGATPDPPTMMARRDLDITWVVFGAATASPPILATSPGIRVVTVTGPDTFATDWNAAMSLPTSAATTGP